MPVNSSSLPPELFWLACTCVMTGLFWIPYVVNRFKELGPPGWAWFPLPDPPPRAPWADRAARAHLNAVENLVVFAPLAVAVHCAGAASPATAIACQAYFWARLAHYVISAVGMPIVPRTMAFLCGVAAQVSLGWALVVG
ncbi:MAG: MAPEG family protein [Polaromonas sp.]|nr:MAPEG family protein [Polaromonas sp.]